MPGPIAMWTGIGAALAGVAGVGIGIAVTGDDAAPVPAAPVSVVADENQAPPVTPDVMPDDAPDVTTDEAPTVGIVLPGPVVAAPLHACPDGAVVGSLRSGDRVVATAVDESGTWVAVRDPLDIGRRVWLRAHLVAPDDTFDSLPAEPCPLPTVDAVVTPGTTSTVPDSSTTVPSTTVPSTTDPSPATTRPPASTPATTAAPPAPATTSPVAPPTTATPPPAPTSPTTAPPTAPPTTAPPTTPPDTSGPTITASVAPGEIWETSPGLCTDKAKSATVTASATDPSGVASIVASWSLGGTVNRDMAGGSTTFGPYTYPTVPDGGQQQVTITVVAVDGAGNSSQRTLSVTVTSAATCFG